MSLLRTKLAVLDHDVTVSQLAINKAFIEVARLKYTQVQAVANSLCSSKARGN